MAANDDPRVWILALHGRDVVAAVLAQLRGEVLDLDLVAEVLEPELDEVAGVGVSYGVDLAVAEVRERLDVIDDPCRLWQAGWGAVHDFPLKLLEFLD